MVSFPLDFPSIGIIQSAFRLRSVVSQSQSPFTGTAQVYRHQGEWWEGEVTFRPTTREEAAEIQAFLLNLGGQYGTFLYGDPDALAHGRMGIGGPVLVNGAGQTGNSLNVDGMLPSRSNILKRGDYFQLGTGTSARLYFCTADLESDETGAGVLQFVPRLRSSPADNTALVTVNPRCAMRLSENNAEWNSDQSSIYGITVAFREALTT